MKDKTMNEYSQKIERLELEVTNLENVLATRKSESKKESDENKVIQQEYQDAVVVIATQQRKLTEYIEKIKVYESLEEVDKENSKAPDNPVEEEWEDKDDSSGELVRQQRTEINKFQWKPAHDCKTCDKVLGSDQHLRQHTKEHHRRNNEIIKCHYCDFITNNVDLHVNHMT